MTTLSEFTEANHKTIILSLLTLIAVFLAACTFHDVLLICHYIFGCDHGLHNVG